MTTEKKTAMTVATLVAMPEYDKRFKDVLGKKAQQFVSSLISASNAPHLRDAEPKSVVAAAMVAATLDLPIDKNLGFAHIVPYNGRDGKIAQFQMGYKGYIQLALRTGQYKTINDVVIPSGVCKKYDRLTGELVLDWDAADESKTPDGYVCFFELLSGFRKTVYWTYENVRRHAERYSKSFKRDDSPWATQFDAMALKTVVKFALSKYGVLSIELQNAYKHDQGIQADLDTEVSFPDNEESRFEAAKVVQVEVDESEKVAADVKPKEDKKSKSHKQEEQGLQVDPPKSYADACMELGVSLETMSGYLNISGIIVGEHPDEAEISFILGRWDQIKRNYLKFQTENS